MPDRFLQRIARVVDSAIGGIGAALGGGNALWAHGVVDRPTTDLDAFVDSQDPERYEQAQAALTAAFEAAGMKAIVLQSDSWFRGFLVTDSVTSETARVDINYSPRDHPPVIIDGVGAVLDIEDLLTGKLQALRFAGVLSSADLGDPVEYQALGMSPEQIDAMVARLRAYADTCRAFDG